MNLEDIFYKNNKPISRRFNDKWLDNNLQIKDYVLLSTSFLDNSYQFKERVFCIINNITSMPQCLACDNPTHLSSDGKGKGFSLYCSRECGFKDPNRIKKLKSSKKAQDHSISNNKRKQTMLSKYGHEYNSQRIEVKRILRDPAPKKLAIEKSRQTKLKKYGYEYFPIMPEVSNTSKEEISVRDFLNNLGFNFKKAMVNGESIDMIDFDAKFAIEYNGEFWHTEDKRIAGKNHHLNKLKACEKDSIRLITINSDEWVKKNYQIKEYLKSALGVFKQRIGARSCTVIKASNLQQRFDMVQFLDDYHIQGRPHSVKEIYGLYNKSELCAVVSYGNHHRKKDTTVLNRLCFKPELQIIGGASKLIKATIKDLNIHEIITWSDNRWSQGDVYQKCGFELDEHLPIDYCYVKGRMIKSKQSMQKKKIGCPDHITEKDFCAQQGWFRMWDCGKIRWKYSLR